MQTLVSPRRIGHKLESISWFVFDDDKFNGKCIIDGKEKVLTLDEIKKYYTNLDPHYSLDLPLIDTAKSNKPKVVEQEVVKEPVVEQPKQPKQKKKEKKTKPVVEEKVVEPKAELKTNDSSYHKVIYLITDQTGSLEFEIDGSYEHAKSMAKRYVRPDRTIVLEKRIIQVYAKKVDEYYILEAYDENSTLVIDQDFSSGELCEQKRAQLVKQHPAWTVKIHHVTESVSSKETIQ